MRLIMIIVFLIGSPSLCFASPGDHQKIMEFMRVSMDSCSMGRDPNKRLGCYSLMK